MKRRFCLLRRVHNHFWRGLAVSSWALTFWICAACSFSWVVRTFICFCCCATVTCQLLNFAIEHGLLLALRSIGLGGVEKIHPRRLRRWGPCPTFHWNRRARTGPSRRQRSHRRCCRYSILLLTWPRTLCTPLRWPITIMLSPVVIAFPALSPTATLLSALVAVRRASHHPWLC